MAHFLPFTKALQAALAERLQQPVEVHIAVMQTYGDGERFIEDGEVDFLELGAAAYVLAREKNADLELLAVRSPSDAKQLAGVICVRTNSPIMNIEQVRGVSMAFGDKRSTTGHFLAQQHLLAQGIKSKDLGRQTHLASHEEVASSVASGQFEAGALNMIAFLQAVRAGKGLRILSRFPNFGRPWICRSSMPAPLKQALKQSLLEVAECPSLGTLEEGDTSMLPADDLDFESLRKAIRENNLFYERSKP